VYCDNYFTSVPLFQELLDHQTYAYGTIRTNRKYLPQNVTKAKLKKQGDVVQRQSDSMVVSAWYDKCTVTILSTNSDPLEGTEVQRRKKDGSVTYVGDDDDWILNIFDEDSGDDENFLGFQNRWTSEKFQPRLKPLYKKVSGATVEHPEEASAGCYF
jgi:hypothetical protein